MTLSSRLFALATVFLILLQSTHAIFEPTKRPLLSSWQKPQQMVLLSRPSQQALISIRRGGALENKHRVQDSKPRHIDWRSCAMFVLVGVNLGLGKTPHTQNTLPLIVALGITNLLFATWKGSRWRTRQELQRREEWRVSLNVFFSYLGVELAETDQTAAIAIWAPLFLSRLGNLSSKNSNASSKDRGWQPSQLLSRKEWRLWVVLIFIAGSFEAANAMQAPNAAFVLKILTSLLCAVLCGRLGSIRWN